TNNATALLRLDWNLAEAHTLTVRLDGRWNSDDPARVRSLAVPSTGGRRTERAGGVMASMTSHLGEQVINEVRGYVSVEHTDAGGQPSSFTRTLERLDRAGTSWNEALYLGDTWRMSDRLQLTYGARLEATEFRGAPGYNPTLDSLFGVRTDRIPREVHASPRFGFTWTLATESGGAGGAGGAGGPGGAGRALPRSILRGG